MASSSSPPRNTSVSPPRNTSVSPPRNTSVSPPRNASVSPPRNALSNVVDSEDLKKHSEAVTAGDSSLKHSEAVTAGDSSLKHSEAVTAGDSSLKHSEAVTAGDSSLKHSEAVTAGDSSLKHSETVTGDSSVVGLWYKSKDGKEDGHILHISAVQGGGYVAKLYNLKGGDLLTELHVLPAPPTDVQVPPAPPTDLQGALCPNLTAIVGEDVAQNLIATAGGLNNLAFTPACNVRMLGASKDNLDASDFRVGHIGHTEMFMNSPAALKSRICTLIANKVMLAARVDYVGGSTDGAYGNRLREEILQKMEKLKRE